jgi:hypothetical protein
MSLTVRLAGASTGVGASTGDITAIGNNTLAGVASGFGASAGALSLSVPLAGSTTGSASASALMTLVRWIEGAASGSSLVSGALTHGVPLSGSSAGTGGAAGDVTAGNTISGSSTGIGSASASLKLFVNLAATVFGNGAAYGAFPRDPLMGDAGASPPKVLRPVGASLVVVPSRAVMISRALGTVSVHIEGVATMTPTVFIGDSARLDFVAKMSDETLLDLTAAKLYCSVKRWTQAPGPGVLYKKNLAAGGTEAQARVVDGYSGKASVYLLPADTVSLGEGEYVFDAVAETPAGDRYTIGSGRFLAKRRVTASLT